MADYIGRLSPAAERLGRLTLRQNRIRSRHYAIRPDGGSDWTVAKLAAEAVKGIVRGAESTRGRSASWPPPPPRTTCSSRPCQRGPRRLRPAADGGRQPAERLRQLDDGAEGRRAAGRAGEHRAALAVGAEFSSRYFRPGHYLGTATMREDGTLPGDAEFLRWTLSDGAAGLLVENRPATRGLSLKLDWISLRSFADRFAPA
jgi:3-oxoacyl-[acyl-carrier-protein] synthase-3